MSDSHAHAHGHGHAHADAHGEHEHKDIKIRGILIFTVVLVLVTIAIQIVLGLWLSSLGYDTEAEARKASPRLADNSGQFPAPRLQGNPGSDMARLRRAETRALERTGWVDKTQGIAHIPIERAMDLIVAQGLPVRKQGEPASAPAAPAEAKSGEAPSAEAKPNP
jgi:hypothetical protein